MQPSSLSTASTQSSKYYEDWLIIDEISYTSPLLKMSNEPVIARKSCFVQDDNSDDTIQDSDEIFHMSDQFINRLEKINKETNEDIKSIKEKLDEIELSWKEGNMNKYMNIDGKNSQLSSLDRLLSEAVKEVVEMKKGASSAVLELTKSVANVDNIIDKSLILKDTSDIFRKTAYNEKRSQGLSFKMQLLVIALAVITAKLVFDFFT